MEFNKRKYDQQYCKDHYYRIPLNVPLEDKEKILKRSKEAGFKSISDYIRNLIYDDINKQNISINIGDISQTGDNNSINIGS